MRPLVVAWGNELRRDDGVAWRLARQLARRGWVVRCCHQLTPEIVEHIVDWDRVVFADAALPGNTQTLSELQPQGPIATGHLASPTGLLQLCHDLYGRGPRAWLLSLPGEHFGLGTGLSGRARQSIRAALVELEQAFGGGDEAETCVDHGSCRTRLP